MARQAWLVVTVLSVSCASTSHRAPTAARSAEPAGASASAAPADLRDLSDAVRALASEPGDPSHRRIVAALEALAGAIRELPSRPLEVAARIREAARQLAASSPRSLEHADLVLRALRDAQGALERQPPPDVRRRDFVLAAVAAERAVRELDPGHPLLQQQELVVAAFEAATNAAYLTHDLPSPFRLARGGAGAPRSLATALDDARTSTLALARASWSDAHGFAAKLMDDLADAVVALGRGGDGDERVAELRFQAQRLERDREVSLDAPGWIKAGLTAALDALEPASADAAGLRDARDAVAGIDTRTSIAFQRAAIQDAVRATLDAFVRAQGCSGLAPRTARRAP